MFSKVADSFLFYRTCRVEQSTLLALVAKALLRTATLPRIVRRIFPLEQVEVVWSFLEIEDSDDIDNNLMPIYCDCFL